jgi:hypothetical protein
MRKNVFVVLLFSLLYFFLFAVEQELPEFPKRYESWMNIIRKEHITFRFDMYNYETSFLPHVVGFDSKGYGSLYARSSVAKYVEKNRNNLADSVIVYCDFLKSCEKWKYKDLKGCFSSFKIHYDEKELQIKEMFCKDISTEDYSLASGDKRYSLSFLFYIDKETFLKISKSESFYLTCNVNNNDYRFDLQIPAVYDDTFKINSEEESNLTEWRDNLLRNGYIYGISDVTEIKDEIVFYADLPSNTSNNKTLIKTDYKRFEFGMMYDYKNAVLKNYTGSFFVKLIKSDGTEFSFSANLGKNSIYLDGDDYELFYFPESFYGEHVKVVITVLENDFPSYIDNVFFYLAFPRSK